LAEHDGIGAAGGLEFADRRDHQHLCGGSASAAMAFLRSSFDADIRPVVRGNGIVLRCPLVSDYARWAELRAKSRSHLVPWEPQWADDELSKAAYKMRLRHYDRELRESSGYAFFIHRSSDGALIGGLTLTNVRRGVTLSCAIGYWIGAPFSGLGYMTNAVQMVTEFAFEGLRLHRVEAACLPNNAASIRVLEKARFQREGLARRYLKINGAWQDHILFACLSDDR
jgi:[ribosomal protein S5]-alanine N-acetyltransferase